MDVDDNTSAARLAALAASAPPSPPSSSPSGGPAAVPVGPNANMAEALNERGWWMLDKVVASNILARMARGSRQQSSVTAVPIFNSHPAEDFEELGDPADFNRRQIAVSNGGVFGSAVSSCLAAVAEHVGGLLRCAYDAVTPHLLIAMPRALPQLAHADYIEEEEENDRGSMLGDGEVAGGVEETAEDGGTGEDESESAPVLTVYVSFMVPTSVDVWSGLFGGGEAGDVVPAEGLPAPLRIVVPVGSCLIVRSSLIHRGTENPHGRRQLRCLHSYLAPHVDGRNHPAYAEYTALL